MMGIRTASTHRLVVLAADSLELIIHPHRTFHYFLGKMNLQRTNYYTFARYPHQYGDSSTIFMVNTAVSTSTE